MIDDILFSDDRCVINSQSIPSGLIDGYSFDGLYFETLPFKSVQSGTYKIEGVTRNNLGSPLGSCTVYLNKFVDGRLHYIESTVSDPITGEYIFFRNDNDAEYVIIARKTGSPNVFDISDFNIIPEVV